MGKGRKMSNTESLLLAERKQLEEMIAETSDERAIEKGSLQARLRVVNRDLFFVREVARRNAELKQTAEYVRQTIRKGQNDD
jgi:hypothetical protein